VLAFGLVQDECRRDGVQDTLGGTAQVTAFESRVVLHAHPGEQGDLSPAQPRDPPVGACRELDLLGADACSTSDEELANVLSVVHADEPRHVPTDEGGPAETPFSGVPGWGVVPIAPTDRGGQTAGVRCRKESRCSSPASPP
jgi:hypothetical protein